MAQICEHCGKKPQVGHQVSHSNRKTLRRFMPNLVSTRVFRPQKKRFEVIKVCSRCLRTLVKRMT